MTLEKMDDFFTARVEGYDEHMLPRRRGMQERLRRDGAGN